MIYFWFPTLAKLNTRMGQYCHLTSIAIVSKEKQAKILPKMFKEDQEETERETHEGRGGAKQGICSQTEQY